MDCFYCGSQECSEICNDCSIFAYCCQDHLAFHKNQDSSCLYFKAKKNEELGRYMVATKPIKPFETVIQDEALAFGPSEFNPACCVICLKKLDDVSFDVCPHCNIPLCTSEVSNHLNLVHMTIYQ